MKYTAFVLFFLSLTSCSTGKIKSANSDTKPDFVLAFGSCNRIDLPNLLWDDILGTKPDVWVWGGDNIYADTGDVEKLRNMYRAQNEVGAYQSLVSATEVMGTWDDHDYGLNDGGIEFEGKAASQQEFLNFMNVPQNSPLRQQEGVYTSRAFKTDKGLLNIIILDTRYFRTALTPDTETEKRIKPNAYGEGSLLGEAQWTWLKDELYDSKADFNIIVSSIQVLSKEHGFETWGNFPHEVDRLTKLISEAGAKGVIVLSGDRHISEFSRTKVQGMDYDLVDFTSSGLTHAYQGFTGEPNVYRLGEVIFTESFGVLEFDFKRKKVHFKMMGDGGEVFAEMEQRYE